MPSGVLPLRRQRHRELGAVGLLGVLSAKLLGTERGDEGAARIRELTKGIGADSVLECVGTHDLALPLEQAEEGFRAIDERRAIKMLLET